MPLRDTSDGCLVMPEPLYHDGPAEPCPTWLKETWIGWLGPERIVELYAGTEAQAATVITGTEWLDHRGSVGRPVEGQVMICDADGVEVPPRALAAGAAPTRPPGDHGARRQDLRPWGAPPPSPYVPGDNHERAVGAGPVVPERRRPWNGCGLAWPRR